MNILYEKFLSSVEFFIVQLVSLHSPLHREGSAGDGPAEGDIPGRSDRVWPEDGRLQCRRPVVSQRALAGRPELDGEQSEADPAVLHDGGLSPRLDILLSAPQYQVGGTGGLTNTDCYCCVSGWTKSHI